MASMRVRPYRRKRAWLGSTGAAGSGFGPRYSDAPICSPNIAAISDIVGPGEADRGNFEAPLLGPHVMTMLRSHAFAAAAAVAATAGPGGTPAADRIAGLANRMYAIVRNVATAPRISAETVEPRDRRSKAWITGLP